MPRVLALLPSPFLGPAIWRPVARVLASAGQQAIVPEATASAPRGPDDVVRWLASAVPADREVVLVPHSNAGLYAPALTAQRRVTGLVFVDARLPEASGDIAMVPPALLDRLRAMADADGLLPPWTHWWDDADLDGLFPDASVRRAVEREQHRLPLSYVAGSVRVPPGWDDRPGAYLAFGDTYAEERAAATRRGWPVATVAGGHLHMLVDPEAVAALVLRLVDEMGSAGRAPRPDGRGALGGVVRASGR